MNSKQKKRQSSPESRFYDRLRGEHVTVVLSRDGSLLLGTLAWVDRYSLGLCIDDEERLLNKRSIETIEKRDKNLQ